jgi:hypothetical protein
MRVALLVVLGCSAAAPPPAPAARGARLELVEGTPATLADGTVVDVSGVAYTYSDDSRHQSSCTLVVTRDGQRVVVPLAREHGGSDPESSGRAHGWVFTLEVADPYRRPRRVVTRVRKL